MIFAEKVISFGVKVSQGHHREYETLVWSDLCVALRISPDEMAV